MEKLGEKIYKLRKREGYSQEELGFRVGVTRQTVSQWESNVLQPKSDKLKLLCEIFKVTSDYFLFNDIQDLSESEAIKETAISNEDLQEKAIFSENDNVNVKQGLSSKIKVSISIIIILLSVSIALLILACIIMPPQKGFDSVTSVTANFSLSNLFICIAGIFLAVVLCLLIAVILIIKRRKK